MERRHLALAQLSMGTLRTTRRFIGMLLVLLMLVSVLAVPGTAKIEAEANSKTSAGGGSVTFYVPETVYLRPGSNNFEYFVDRAKTGVLSQEASKNTGTIYFKVPGMQNVKIVARLVNPVTGVTGLNLYGEWKGLTGLPQKIDNVKANNQGVDALLLQSTADKEINATINGYDTQTGRKSFLIGSLLAHQTQVIEWEATYEKEVTNALGQTTTHSFVAYNYTVVYGTNHEESGTFGTYLNRKDGISLYPDRSNSYAFIAGAHSVSGGNYARIINGSSLPSVLLEWHDDYINGGNEISGITGYVDSKNGNVNRIPTYWTEQANGGVLLCDIWEKSGNADVTMTTPNP
ncbi:MAG: hypothetical protein LBB67_03565, partial [Oscillospiraceae bacterium]|nr:hypothetical protein [Oscillospiraceae bacterium]